MSTNINIPLRTFNDILELLNLSWHSKDYLVGTKEIAIDEISTMDCRQDFYEIAIIVSGYLETRINNEIIRLEPKSILLLAPYTVIQSHDFRGTFELRTICFTESFIANSLLNIKVLDFLDLFFKNTGKAIQLNKNEFETLDKMYSILDEAVNEEKEGVNRKHYISTLILAYLFKTFDIFDSTFKDNGVLSPDAETVSKFRLLILKKPNNNLEFYADELNVSTQHLIRIVKRNTNKTPYTLISESLVINAKILLKNPNLTITEISEELSFSDNSSFGKFFKKHTDISPNSYRNKP